MLNADRLFQTLLSDMPANLPLGQEKTVGADLDVDSIETVPFLTHSTQIAQDSNSYGLYSATLSVSIFLAPRETPLSFVQSIYDGIWDWDKLPTSGVLAGVGAVESIDREISAFTRLTAGVQMLNKSVTQYVGSWELTIREH